MYIDYVVAIFFLPFEIVFIQLWRTKALQRGESCHADRITYAASYNIFVFSACFVYEVAANHIVRLTIATVSFGKLVVAYD